MTIVETIYVAPTRLNFATKLIEHTMTALGKKHVTTLSLTQVLNAMMLTSFTSQITFNCGMFKL